MTLSTIVLFFGCSIISGVFVLDAKTLNHDSVSDLISKVPEHQLTEQDTSTATCTAPEALGMENYLIPDTAITASSWLYYNTDFYGPQQARLNIFLGPWVKHDTDQTPWIQVDLEAEGVVTGLKTQGAESQDKTVTAFKAKAGTTQCGMQYIPGSDGNPKVFTTGHAVTTHTFPQAVAARFVRIEPTAWTEYCALRFEIFGCLDIVRCLPGWEEYNGVCYFLDHGATANFDEAIAECTSRGSQIASIHSQDEQDFLAGLIRGNGQQWHGYFIGLSDTETEGTFVWTDSTPLDFTAWTSGEPNNWGGGEDCVGMWPNGNGKWNDYPCGGGYAYICEKAKDSTRYGSKAKQSTPSEMEKPLQRAVCAAPVALGMESGQLATSLISASTVWFNDINNHGWQFSRLNNAGKRWVAHASDNTPWIQVDLYGASNTVSGVITQGSPSNDEWVTTFQVRAGTELCNLQHIVGSDNNPVVYNGNSDRNTEVTHTFPTPVTARFVRIEPTQWKVTCSLRFEVIGCFTSTTPPNCESGWKMLGNYCYYFADTAKVDFSTAESECQSKGAMLASIHSQDEQDFIASQTKHDGTSGSWFGYWIGFTDSVTENTFVWVDGTPNDYTYWYPGEPNNVHEDCTGVVQNQGPDKWNDYSCSTTQAYVCKKQG